MNAHRHQLEVSAGCGAGITKSRIPGKRRRNLAAICQRYHDFIGCEGNRDWPDIADIKKRVDQLKKDGKKSVLLLVANGEGELRFVALSVQ